MSFRKHIWTWPMANIYNKRLAFGKAPEPGLLGGVLPFAPINRTAPKNAEFSLYVRAYWPDDAITSDRWTPAAVVKVR